MNLWAYRKHNLGATFVPAGEWDEVIEFDSLPDLISKVNDKKIARGQMRKLGVVAHGDVPGRIEMVPQDLMASTVDQFSESFRALEPYLWESARIIFYSCIAGQAPAGSALLNALSSQYFPGRHVIGFEKFGLVNPAIGQPAGNMWCSEKFIGAKFDEASYCSPAANITTVRDLRVRKDQILTEYAIYSKWSYKGRIIKIPYNEVIQDARAQQEQEMFWGVEQVSKALKADPKKIQYISLSRQHASSKLTNLYGNIIQAGFRWVTDYDVMQGLHEWSAKEVTLARKHHVKLSPSEMILAVNKHERVTVYKCAWPGCPTHKNYVDRCPQGLDHIPNGPNV
jgi:hypothetical protein